MGRGPAAGAKHPVPHPAQGGHTKVKRMKPVVVLVKALEVCKEGDAVVVEEVVAQVVCAVATAAPRKQGAQGRQGQEGE